MANSMTRGTKNDESLSKNQIVMYLPELESGAWNFAHLELAL